jgi:hypothetical protein
MTAWNSALLATLANADELDVSPHPPVWHFLPRADHGPDLAEHSTLDKTEEDRHYLRTRGHLGGHLGTTRVLDVRPR